MVAIETSNYYLNQGLIDRVRTSALYTSMPLSIAAAVWGGRLTSFGWGKRLVGTFVATNALARLASCLIRPGARKLEGVTLFPFKGDLPNPSERLWAKLSWSDKALHILTRPLARMLIFPGSTILGWLAYLAQPLAHEEIYVESPYDNGTILLHGYLRQPWEKKRDTLHVAFGGNCFISPLSLTYWGLALRQLDADILTVDLPGHGMSEGRPDEDSTLAAAKRIGEVAMELGYKRVAFTGISHGTPHAAQAALAAYNVRQSDEQIGLWIDRGYTSLADAADNFGYGPFASMIKRLYPYETTQLVEEVARTGQVNIVVSWSEHDEVVGDLGHQLCEQLRSKGQDVKEVDMSKRTTDGGRHVKHRTSVEFDQPGKLLFEE